MTFLGMDTEEVAELVGRLRDGEQRLEALTSGLGETVSRSAEFWRGPDAEAFRSDWGSTSAELRVAGQSLASRGTELTGHQDEQTAASEGDDSGGGGSGNGGPGGDGSADASAQDGPNAPGEEPYYGEVDPEVAERWELMSQEDREAVARVIIEEELREYGIEGVPIDFDLTGSNGLWSVRGDAHEISINGGALDTPRLLHTLAHEARHAAQWEAVQDTESGFWDWLPGVDSTTDDYERLQEDHGFTREEIDSWREHFDAPEDERDPYLDQSIEVDARNAGAEFSEELTMEDLDRYEELAGV